MLNKSRARMGVMLLISNYQGWRVKTSKIVVVDF